MKRLYKARCHRLFNMVYQTSYQTANPVSILWHDGGGGGGGGDETDNKDRIIRTMI